MKKEKKLQLNKETLRNLSDDSLSNVAGGGGGGGGKTQGILTVCSLGCNSFICHSGAIC